MAVVNHNTYISMSAQASQSGHMRNAADRELLAARARLSQFEKEENALRTGSSRMIEKKIREAQKILQDDIDELREEFGRQLGKQAVTAKKMLDDVRRLAESNSKELDHVNKRISALEKQLDSTFKELVTQIDTARKQAVCYYDQLSNMIEQIGKMHPETYEILFPDVLQPGYAVLRNSLMSVLDDLNQGCYEAAIGVAQTRLPEAVNMLGHLEFYHASYLRVSREASSLLETLEGQLRVMRSTEGKPITFGNEVEYEDAHGADYWARELYEDLRNKTDALSSRLSEYAETLDFEAMEPLIPQLQEIARQCSDCTAISDRERQLHFACVERAAQVYDILHRNDSSWSVKEWHINDDDLRDPISFVLTRPEGYCVAIACIPERGAPFQQGTVRVELDSFDCGMSKNDFGRCKIIYENTAAVLGESGILQGSTCKPKGFTADSQAFIQETAANEKASRTMWLNQTKRTLGL